VSTTSIRAIKILNSGQSGIRNILTQAELTEKDILVIALTSCQ
jgi:fructose-specific phosphotransferase system component IIB